MAMRKERRYKLGILTTHPVQYQVPWFQELAARSDVDLSVFFCMIPNERQQGEGFGIDFRWDIPLLDGYRHEVLKNRSPHPSVSRYDGCDTPGISRIDSNSPRVTLSMLQTSTPKFSKTARQRLKPNVMQNWTLKKTMMYFRVFDKEGGSGSPADEEVTNTRT